VNTKTQKNKSPSGGPAGGLSARARGAGGKAPPSPQAESDSGVQGQVFAPPVPPFIRGVERSPDEPGARHWTY